MAGAALAVGGAAPAVVGRLGRFDVTMPDPFAVIRSSVDRLTTIVGPLDDDEIAGRAFPKDWSIADVCSHLGSGAEIWQRRVADALERSDTPDDFNDRVWDTWNAKSPRAKVDDAIVAMEAFISAIDALTADERARLQVPIGPMSFDFESFLGLRANEHVLHEWDIAVAIDPETTLAADGVETVIDNLDLVGRFTAKPTGERREITVRTYLPGRSFRVTLDTESVAFAQTEVVDHVDVEMPAESFIRLVYGRLDPTPAQNEAVDVLRLVFPGP